MGKKKYLMNRKGSAVLQTLIISVVSVMAFLGFISLSVATMKQLSVSQDKTIYRVALSSLMDYTLYSVRNRWCMNSEWSRDLNCGINHDRSFERLLFTDPSIRALDGMVKRGVMSVDPAQVPPYRLTSIAREVDISTLSSDHVLYEVLSRVDTSIYDRFHVRVEHAANSKFPVRGVESVLVATARLLSPDPLVKELVVESQVIVYPRELGMFSLIVPRDLRLDLNSASSAVGDTNIQNFGVSPGGDGIIFYSPVFANRNLHLPAAGGYSPATFSGKVILGNGGVFRGTAPYSPANSGGSGNNFFNELGTFGGIYEGVDIDGEFDNGLSVLVGQAAANPPSTEQMEECINLVRAKSDLEYTSRSALMIKKISPSGNSFSDTHEFLIGLSGSVDAVPPDGSGTDYQNLAFQNRFLKQYREDRVVRKSPSSPPPGPGYYYGGGWTVDPRSTLAEEHPTVLRVQAEFGQNRFEHNAPSTPPPHELHYFDARLGINSTTGTGSVVNGCVSRNRADPAAHGEACLRIEVEPFSFNGQFQHHILRVRVHFSKSEPSGSDLGDEVVLRFDAFDHGVFNERDRREITLSAPGTPASTFYDDQFDPPIRNDYFSRRGGIEFEINGAGQARLSGPVMGNWSQARNWQIADETRRNSADSQQIAANNAILNPANNQLPNENIDLRSMYQTCFTTPDNVKGDSFGGVSWNYDFLDSTRVSWNFNPVPSTGYSFTYPNSSTPTLVFDASNTSEFTVRSIVGRCEIASTTSFVSGLLVCDEFAISPRTTPLTIVGTVISGRTNIAASALTAGVKWYSIYHPQAKQLLRANQVLRRNAQAQACPEILPFPVWSTALSSQQRLDLYTCNSLSLRGRADPFRWTTVDPDCGVPDGDEEVRCKRRNRRHHYREVYRKVDI